ncbi:hypothetical protein [Actinomadura sp. 3N407]|uniref:hypothetical protein n=1 Tax=Actinomadura sp. 3N407 TaxID=3457423 RepID=UPI003FCDF11E
MIYRVEETKDVLAELSAFPHQALTAYLDLRTSLGTEPWNGAQYNPDDPAGANVRTQRFGAGRGIARYVIIEHHESSEHRVAVIRVTWA